MNAKGLTGRRTILPTPRPDTEGLSLWNLLYKNIGKDLSQISMPVALNEPLNMLQRLCEDLEYSELLDKAAEIDDPYERMVHVAAFAVSTYANSLTRAGNKPFNPLLGETYECIREDKGFRFLAEQVSHHPPISACHAESRNFTFWQEARIKTKFWGKSMEFQPMGQVHVLLPKTGDLYTWNKVTTCVHNLFSTQRWVDQYGELYITNGQISCKLTFAKASYWSSKRHEVSESVRFLTRCYASRQVRLLLLQFVLPQWKIFCRCSLKCLRIGNKHIFDVTDTGCSPRRNGKPRLQIVREVVGGPVLRRGPGRQVHLEGGNDAVRSRALLRLHAFRHGVERAGTRLAPVTADRHQAEARSEGPGERRPAAGRIAQIPTGERPEGPPQEAGRDEAGVRAAVVFAEEERQGGPVGVQREVLGRPQESGFR